MALSQKKDIKIAGEAENGMQLPHLLKHNFPDVILLDIPMPVINGITALTSIRKSYSDLKVIMLSMYNDHSMVSTLMETGANACLTKSADSESIYEAIKTCYSKSY
jgi:DNA-binding NarL/FixJ family response regulator